MNQLERIIFWSFLALAVFFGSAFYSVIENMQEEVDRNTAALKNPRIEAAMYPGIPAALRDQWRAAMGDKAPSDADYWVTLRAANFGDADASAVTARLTMAAPVSQVVTQGLGGQVLEGAGDGPVEVRFDRLPVKGEALVFVAIRPVGFEAAPPTAEARLRWTGAAPHHWREVEITGRSGDFGAEEALAHLYGLGGAQQG